MAVVGCTETRSYNLAVKNGLDAPVTVCMTKSAGPAEADWESPEQAAGPAHSSSDARVPGVVLAPGKTATRTGVEGKFYRDRGQAVLRVYAGTPSLNRMNAIARGDVDRVDYVLSPGDNDLVITHGADGLMAVVPTATTRPAAE